jgi:hypothetical protein
MCVNVYMGQLYTHTPAAAGVGCWCRGSPVACGVALAVVRTGLSGWGAR